MLVSLEVNVAHTSTYLNSTCFTEGKSTFLYFQALRLSNASRRTTTVGEIVNLMSVDAQKIHDIFANIHEFWASPISVAVALYMMWQVG